MKSIPGYPGYQIDDEGRVCSLRGLQERILQPQLGGVRKDRPYVKVTVEKKGGKRLRKSVAVGELQLRAAGVPRPAGQILSYRDGNPLNNAVTNLQWVRREEYDAPRKAYKRTRSHKLTSCKVQLIRSLAASGWKTGELAKRFSCGTQTIWRIIKRKTWLHVP